VPDTDKNEPASGATPVAFYRPSAWYWRRDIAAAERRDDAAALATYCRALVTDLEAHKAALREVGLIPPKTRLSPSEAAAKPHLVRRA
jgi:hypothetical protein